MVFSKPHKVDRFWLLGLLVIAFASSLYFNPWKHQRVIQHDVTSYYSYLPAVFIYNDLEIKFADNLPEAGIWVTQDPDGSRYLRMTSGCALLWAPFFIPTYLADFALGNGEVKPNGYEIQYHFLIAFAAIFYLILGLWLLKKTLTRWFSDSISWLAVSAIYLASNLFYYTHIAPGMSHVYSFFLVSAFYYLWYAKHSLKFIKQLILLALCAGMVVLIRPTNLLILTVPLLTDLLKYRRQSFAILQDKGFSLKHIVYGLVFGLLPVLPQLIYWYLTTGNIVKYSYDDEGFFWKNIHFIDGWFSYRKGWLIFSPIFLLSLAGLVFGLRKWPAFSKANIAVLLVFSYLTFSWWCWWYGGGFGARPFIEYYPFLAFPLAVILLKINRKYLRVALVLVFVVQNMLFSYLERRFVVHYDSMTKSAWTKVVTGNWKMDSQDYTSPDYTGMKYFGEELHLGNRIPDYTLPNEDYKVFESNSWNGEVLETCISYFNSKKYIGNDTLKLGISVVYGNDNKLLHWEDQKIVFNPEMENQWQFVKVQLKQPLDSSIQLKNPRFNKFLYKLNDVRLPFVVENCN